MARVLLVALFLFSGSSFLGGGPVLGAELTFEEHVLPILKARCFACHSTGKRQHGLDVRQRQLLARGGDTGPALVPGKPQQSLFFRRAAAGEMPPGKREKLTPAELETLRRWIEAGAPTRTDEPPLPDDDDEFVTAEDREHWSFQPLRRPPLPTSIEGSRARHPIDRFLERRLADAGLELSPDAPRQTLIRRLHYDLIGLPPSPAAIDAFLRDRSPNAYERLVDSLLASARYGERWGRHWLDVAGYADSEGYSDNDPVRASAWRYRDYVVSAFNADKPYDAFLAEQLAGDELAGYPSRALDDRGRHLLTATGYLRCAADGSGQGGVDEKVARAQVVADTVKIFGSGVLGLTLGCAQCHDHRYDPISQKDYHRIRAAFEPALNLAEWKSPSARQISLRTEEERRRIQEIDATLAAKRTYRNETQKQLVDAAFEKELLKVPSENQELGRAAFRTEAKERTEEQKALLARFPFLAVTGGNLYQYNQKGADQIKKLDAEIRELEGRKPAEQFIRALWEEPGKVPPSRLLIRGDPDQPAESVAPGALAVLTPPSRSFTFKPANEAPGGNEATTSGRRSRLAAWLTEPRHPLTARVLVNRVWMHHFGRGLVATAGDFGTQGEAPTHPLLLDWLATDFVDGGWSIKRLHRQIVTSTAYRQVSTKSTRGTAQDPENRLLWRKPLQRLEGEVLRDAILATTGRLSTRMGGPPAPVREDSHGRIVVGIDKKAASNRPGEAIPAGEDGYRRTLYVSVRRSQPLSFTKAFDVPVMETNCVRRSVSTVAPQALSLLNGAFAREQSQQFAARVVAHSGNAQERVAYAFLIAFGRLPTRNERADALSFLNEQTTLIATRAATSAETSKGSEDTSPQDRASESNQEALVNFCQVLVNSSEFAFIE